MDKIENSQVERVLRNDELDTVSGGFGFVERFTNPLSSAGSIRSQTRLPRLWHTKATSDSEPGSI